MSPIDQTSTLDYLILFQSSIDKLNKKIIQGEDPGDLKKRIEKIIDTTEKMRAEQQATLDAQKFMYLPLRTWRYIGATATGISITANLANLAINIPVAVLQNNSTVIVPLGIAEATSAAAGLGVFAGFVMILNDYVQKKVENLHKAQQRKVQETESLKQFFLAYQEFISVKPKSSLEETSELLKNCIEILKSIPPHLLPEQARDRWICSLITSLPDSHELKQQLLAQKELAEEISKKAQQTLKIEISHSSSSESPQKSFLSVSNADQATRRRSTMTLGTMQERYNHNFNRIRDTLDIEIEELNVQGLYFDYSGDVSNVAKRKKTKDPQVVIS